MLESPQHSSQDKYLQMVERSFSLLSPLVCSHSWNRQGKESRPSPSHLHKEDNPKALVGWSRTLGIMGWKELSFLSIM